MTTRNVIHLKSGKKLTLVMDENIATELEYDVFEQGNLMIHKDGISINIPKQNIDYMTSEQGD